MKFGSLFSGYGGLERGVQAVIGGETAWVSDIDKGACKILAHRYSDVPNLGDISTVNWSQVEPVDVITGGFPCQDISSSGGKVGVRVGKRSGLWTQMARAVSEIRPRLVVVENVRDLLVRGIDVVLGDFSSLGYDAQWTTVSACAVGAPFARVRLFLTATPSGADCTGLGRLPELDSMAQPTSDGLDWRHAHRLALEDQRALDRWGRLVGRPAPDPLDWGVNAQPRLAPQFTEWLMGLPAGWVTDVPDLTRNGQLKALGNGVVPQQAEAALRFLLPTMTAVAA